MLVGEGPGKNEDKDGIPFVGVSGREQDHTYFGLAGLDRREVFISNVVQCRCERGGADVRPGNSLLSACAENHLAIELLAVNPKILILCGAT
ncbi:MAG TPA: uracil-DNA glycosylase family protein, partial [Nitrospira sp.]|nr:uracil-DNA glycosylase family protein [Nitrospira sp.]